MPNSDEKFMHEAIKEAELALREGNWPIGCVIVLNNKIIARGHNQIYTTKNKLAHAEMNAIYRANDILYENRCEATLYTTYEPCPMCFGAIILSRIRRVVCGIDIDDSGAMYFRKNLPGLFKQDKFHVEFTTNVLADQCHDIFIQGKPTEKLIDNGILKKKSKK